MINKNRLWGYSVMKESHLQAVHDDDLETLLNSLGVYDRVCKKISACIVCKRTVGLDNIGAIIPFDGEVVFSCNEPLCLQSVMRGGGYNDIRRD